MTRIPRSDEPDSWHHVMNRGIARRPVFEARTDIRHFLAGLATEVRTGSIEVHAYTVLATHFHLLIRSREGQLAQAMQRIQNGYVRWFNRSRRRDGPLFRGRFRSRRVRSEAYRCVLVSYIDNNPVEAGLVVDPTDYPYGSAQKIAAGRGAPWLSRSWIESSELRCRGPQSFTPEAASTWRKSIARIALAPSVAEDDLDELLDATPAGVREWMIRKARLADGTALAVPVCSEHVVMHAARDAWWSATRAGGSCALGARADWPAIQVGLMRELCGSSLAEVARLIGMTIGAAGKVHARHREMVVGDAEYSALVAEIAAKAIGVGHPVVRRNVVRERLVSASTVPGTQFARGGRIGSQAPAANGIVGQAPAHCADPARGAWLRLRPLRAQTVPGTVLE